MMFLVEKYFWLQVSQKKRYIQYYVSLVIRDFIQVSRFDELLKLIYL